MSSIEAQSGSPVPVFAALGSATRLELLSRLSGGDEYSISALTQGLELTRQATTKHLLVLQDAGIVNCRRVGRENRFSMQPDSINQARAYLGRVSDQWDSAIRRLQATLGE